MMLGFVVLYAMIAAVPAPALPAADSTVTEAPVVEASTSVITDLTELPLHVLKRLPSPVDFDYDGDGKLDPLSVQLDAKGFLLLMITSSQTQRQQVLHKACESLTALKARAFGMNLQGDPETGVEWSLWGVASQGRVASLTYLVRPTGLQIVEKGKRQALKWSGAAFVLK